MRVHEGWACHQELPAGAERTQDQARIVQARTHPYRHVDAFGNQFHPATGQLQIHLHVRMRQQEARQELGQKQMRHAGRAAHPDPAGGMLRGALGHVQRPLRRAGDGFAVRIELGTDFGEADRTG